MMKLYQQAGGFRAKHIVRNSFLPCTIIAVGEGATAREAVTRCVEAVRHLGGAPRQVAIDRWLTRYTVYG